MYGFIGFFLFFSLNQLNAAEFKVMSFNTLCDVCSNEKFDSFSERKKVIRKIIENEKADLYSLQEVRSGSQFKSFFKNFKNYEFIFWENFLFSYADPALAINKKRFEVLEKGQFWLGPNDGKFTVGWKYALPRQAQWVKLKDKTNQTEFIFIGSHFDNRVENMIGSAKMVNKFIKDKKLPVIFAADTNCTVDFEGYSLLTSEDLENTFNKKFMYKNMESKKEGKKLCYLRKGKFFPDCRVDHILYSKDGPWKVSDWSINSYKDEKAINYPSDHRPITATLTY